MSRKHNAQILFEQHTVLFRAKLKISLFPLTQPTLSKSRLNFSYWKFAVTFFFLFSFRSKFVLLKIPYFRFVSPKDRYFRITEHIFVIKKKAYLPISHTELLVLAGSRPTTLYGRLPTYMYLLTSKIVGRVRGNRNIFNCGLIFRYM